jgi:hypothetical protein
MILFEKHPAWRVLPDIKDWHNCLYTSCETYIHWVCQWKKMKKEKKKKKKKEANAHWRRCFICHKCSGFWVKPTMGLYLTPAKLQTTTVRS